MSWTYRVVKRIHANGEIEYGIHEVFTHEGKVGPTANPVAVTAHDRKEVGYVLMRMSKAFDKPTIILDSNGDIIGEEE